MLAEHLWASQDIPELMVVSYDFQENPHNRKKSDTLDLQGQHSPTVLKCEYTLPSCFENKAKTALYFDLTILDSFLLSLFRSFVLSDFIWNEVRKTSSYSTLLALQNSGPFIQLNPKTGFGSDILL